MLRAVEDGIQSIRPLVQARQLVPLASLGPTVESIEYRLPRPEAFRQVTPRHPGTSPPKHRLDEATVVLAAPAGAPLPFQNDRDLRPLPLVELRSNHRGSAMEHTGLAMDKFSAPSGHGHGHGHVYGSAIQGQGLVSLAASGNTWLCQNCRGTGS